VFDSRSAGRPLACVPAVEKLPWETCVTEANEPRNDLERNVLAAQEGRMTSDDLLKLLMDAQVFMPVADEKPAVLNIQRSTHAQPLFLSGEDGGPVLALFSSPERAKPFVADCPGFGGGLLVEFKWVLEKMGAGYAIALNPGSEIGFDMEPETVADLVERIAADGQKDLQ
jgi:SseB protein N-terminal domain